MTISGYYNPFSILQIDSDTSDDEKPSKKKSSLEEKVSQIKNIILAKNEESKAETPLHLTLKDKLRSFTLAERALNFSVLLKKHTVLTQEYMKTRELFSCLFDKVIFGGSGKQCSNSSYFLLKLLLKDSQLATLPTSFYRQAYFLMHGWVERFFKLKNPDSLQHDPVILLNQAFDENRLNYHQYMTLKMLFQVYRYFLRINESENPLIPQVLHKECHETQEVSYDKFLKDVELSSQALASLHGDFSLVLNKEFDVVVPSKGYNGANPKVSNTSKAVLNQLKSNLSKVLKTDLQAVLLLKDESFDDIDFREKFCSMHIKKIDYHFVDLQELLGYLEGMDFENLNTVSLPLLHHLMYKVAILLESSLLLYMSYNPIGSSKDSSKHIIFSVSPNATKERLLCHEHKINRLLEAIKETPYRICLFKEQLNNIYLFNNFSNSTARYPDRSTGKFAVIWQDYLNSAMNNDTSTSNQNNVHLKAIKESIFSSLDFVNKVLEQYLNCFSE
jgi:hypothetical protein